MLIPVNELKVNDIFKFASEIGDDYVVESVSDSSYSIHNMVTQKVLDLRFDYHRGVLMYAKMTHVHINDIQAGDTVYHNGMLHTVCKNNISKGGFMGISLFGDSYRLGNKLVKKINFLGR